MWAQNQVGPDLYLHRNKEVTDSGGINKTKKLHDSSVLRFKTLLASGGLA